MNLELVQIKQQNKIMEIIDHPLPHLNKAIDEGEVSTV